MLHATHVAIMQVVKDYPEIQAADVCLAFKGTSDFIAGIDSYDHAQVQNEEIQKMRKNRHIRDGLLG